MGEGSKQVRVDNWGIFFLQRLQMFFNKTDYCDLTLQFEGNVQLKVHRLVMNACTEYFQMLEQTCDMIDDVLIMPADLQADVVLPIVNFMYTGMLEFHMSLFDKLHKTAKLMNITVLTKLLDAQKAPVTTTTPKSNKKQSQHWSSHGKKSSTRAADPDLPAPLPGRKLPVWKRKSAPLAMPHSLISHYSHYSEPKRNVRSESLGSFDNKPKPTRFEWPEEELSSMNMFDGGFNEISYTSKPLLTQDDEPRPSTSFDRIKETPDNNRRAPNYNNTVINIEEVKDYVKEQKIRSNMIDDDDDDENIDNDFSNDFNDKSNSSQDSLKRKMKSDPSSMKKVRFSVNEKENQLRTSKINITPTGKTSDVDHTKLISEVLKKYPNLVKKNKNIRLKILAKNSNSPIPQVYESKRSTAAKVASLSSNKNNRVLNEQNDDDGPWKCVKCSTSEESVEFVLYYLYRKHMTDVHNEKFDPRMCKYCGRQFLKNNLLMYHQYTKHGVKPPIAYKFPKCDQCPYISLSEALLIRHKANHTKFELKCSECMVTFKNQMALNLHMEIIGHSGKSGKPNYECQYCTKKFSSEDVLFAHIRLNHRDDARRDGIVSIDESIDYDDDSQEQIQEIVEEEEVEYITSEIEPDVLAKEKIKILSDVKLPTMEMQEQEGMDQQTIALEPSSEAEALSNVASGIATSLGLVDVVVLDENQQYILRTENEQGIPAGGSEYIIPDLQDSQTYTTTQQVITSEQNVISQSILQNSDIGSTDELVMVLTDHDYGDGNNEIMNTDNSNIVVLYSHPIEGQENQFITSQGNLMLTSQAGLIELRNNTIVTTSGHSFIASTSDASDNTHIESIEMIQREINNHPDIKNQIQIVNEIKTNLVDENSTSSVPQIASSNPEENPPQISIMEAENIPSEEPSQVDQLQFNEASEVISENQENSTEELQNVESTPQEPDNVEYAKIETDVDLNQEQLQPEAMEIQPNEPQLMDESEPMEVNQDETKTEETPIMPPQEEESENINDEAKSEQPQESLEATELNSSPETEETEPIKETIPNLTTEEEEITIEQSLSQPIPESNAEAQIEETQAPMANKDEEVVNNFDSHFEEKRIEDVSEENSRSEETLEYENSCEKLSMIDKSAEEEENEKIPAIEDDVSQNSPSSNKKTFISSNSNQSAKKILEDWDDTDSQQSESKQEANVNKIIDEWDDDDDDKKI